MREQVTQTVRFQQENDHRKSSTLHVLLVFDSTIHGEKNVKLSDFGCCEKFTVLKSGEAGVTSRLAIVFWEILPKALIEAFVDQNTHLGTRK
jgi:hypothetical protein